MYESKIHRRTTSTAIERMVLFIPSILLLLSMNIFGQTTDGNSNTLSSSNPATLSCPQSASQNQPENFENHVWAKVGEAICLRCHHPMGEASESLFVLQKPNGVRDTSSLSHNAEQFWKIAGYTKDGEVVVLKKILGEMEHGGGQVIEKDSVAWKTMQQFVDHVRASGNSHSGFTFKNDSAEPLLDSRNLSLVSPTALWRRLTLSLGARLPTPEELTQIRRDGVQAVDILLDNLMTEAAFYERLKEGFNDILLTEGIEDNAETLLSYEHFEKTRNWYQHYDLSPIPQEKQERERWNLAAIYRKALLREPYELLVYIVKNNRPFTEAVTADYIMVSPYTARGYGIFEDIKSKFKDPTDPFEYIPAQLPALTNRSGKRQDSPIGFYPHSGILSSFHYLRRYPSTETNRNRLRARMIYQHWLGIDVMALAPRSSDASAVTAKYANPTMEAADCVICHRQIDPLAGIYQDYNFEGHFGPRPKGWYDDMFAPGFDSESLTAEEKWKAPAWLGQRIAQDPRFSIAMVEHVYFILFGRRPLLPPLDIEDPYFSQRRCIFVGQRTLIEDIAQRFRESNYNLKVVFKELAKSDFYRADSWQPGDITPEQQAYYEDIGVVRLLSPEQLERKIAAIFGKRWGRLHDEMAILYGGIDSITVTERNPTPSGAMGAVQRMMANDISCYHVARDFRKPKQERLLFPFVEPDTQPGSDADNQLLRQQISYLHERLLGKEDHVDSEAVTTTLELFTDIQQELSKTPGLERRESYFCGGREEFRADDPNFTLRSWRAVVTYLLRQREFLYE